MQLSKRKLVDRHMEWYKNRRATVRISLAKQQLQQCFGFEVNLVLGAPRASFLAKELCSSMPGATGYKEEDLRLVEATLGVTFIAMVWGTQLLLRRRTVLKSPEAYRRRDTEEN